MLLLLPQLLNDWLLLLLLEAWRHRRELLPLLYWLPCTRS
jgi:hypothetical protein